MKKKYNIYIAVWFVLFIPGCVLLGGSKESSESTSVSNVDKTIVSVLEFEGLLDKAIKDISSDDEYDNFILFVHGRGKHPEKAYKKTLISDLEKDYSAKVIMFHWPSWKGPFAFPVNNARKSAHDFGTVISQLREYKKNNHQLTNSIKFTLLTHSMGSIVLEEFLKEEENSIDGLFNTILISSSASAGKEHANWMNRVGSDNLYVTVNKEDPLLGKAGVKMKGRRLGKGLQNRAGELFDLAQNAKYIDLTESSLRHRYYIHRDLKKRPIAKSFFNEVLGGNSATLKLGDTVKEKKRKQIYILKRHP